jgi:hypothetical protein
MLRGMRRGFGLELILSTIASGRQALDRMVPV